VNEMIQATTLSDQEDCWLSPFCRGYSKLDTSGVYRLIKSFNGQNDPASEFTWKSSAPLRVRFFIWLLMQGRIQCRKNLFVKHIVDSPLCEICNNEEESADHIIFHCDFAVAF
jgi:hypothetical protein